MIAVSAESREALYLVEDIKAIVAELESEKRTLAISVELVDAELAHVYANSKKAEVCVLTPSNAILPTYLSGIAYHLAFTNYQYPTI